MNNIAKRCEAKATPKGSSLVLYGDIGKTMFGDGISASDVQAALAECKGPLAIYINSAGGNVFEGVAIYNQLRRYDRGPVTCYVDGIAASIASVIAMAGSRLIMAKASQMMIHQASAGVIGTAADFRKCADTLDQLDQMIRGIYVDKTGAAPETVASLMAAETWMSAEECIQQKFADELAEADQDEEPTAAASITLLDTYKKTPENLRSTSATMALAQLELMMQRSLLHYPEEKQKSA